jgi:phage baseplate assembly protein W
MKKKAGFMDSKIINEPAPKVKLEEYRRLRNADYVYRDFSAIIDGNRTESDLDDIMRGLTSDFDVEAVMNSLRNIFLVNKAELPGKPQFGNPLKLELFDLFDEFNVILIKDSIKAEIERYDPRIDLVDIEVSPFYDLNRIVVKITFYVIIKDNKIKESIYLPFSHNDHTYITGRSTFTPK